MAITTDYTAQQAFLDGQYYEPTETETTDVLGKDAFLTMMVAQLKHQDPLNPLDGTDFTAQLAQFSSLEQQLTSNSNLEAILETLKTSTSEANLLDYMGKEIVSDGNPVTLNNGEMVSGGTYSIEEDALVAVIIYDSNDIPVRTLSSGRSVVPKGAYSINWDGKDDNGYTAVDGTYTYDVIAWGSNGNYIPVSTTAAGMVTGIKTIGDKTYLLINDQKVDPSNVEAVRLPDNQDETG